VGVSLVVCRRELLSAAILLLAVAIVIAAGVIPPVESDPSPSATQDAAVPALSVNVVFNVLAAMVLGFIAGRTTGRSRRLSFVLGSLSVLILLFAFALSDAAIALRSHGPTMQSARTLLFYCVVADLLAVLLIIMATVLLPRRT